MCMSVAENVPIGLVWIEEGYEHDMRNCMLTERQHAEAKSIGQATLSQLVEEAEGACARLLLHYPLDTLHSTYPGLSVDLLAAGRYAELLRQPDNPDYPYDALDVISALRVGHHRRQEQLRQHLGISDDLPHALQGDIDAAAGAVYFPPKGRIPVIEPWIPAAWRRFDMALPSRSARHA